LRVGGYLMAARRRGPLSSELETIEKMLSDVEDPLSRAEGCDCSEYPADNPVCRQHGKYAETSLEEDSGNFLTKGE
jgi:hypothetical protein